VGADGTFQLGTYKRNDGAPPGEYDVTVTWTKPLIPGEPDEMSLVPPRYLTPQTSKLHAQVKAEVNDLPPFNLTR
jgi:hypothetical protein